MLIHGAELEAVDNVDRQAGRRRRSSNAGQRVPTTPALVVVLAVAAALPLLLAVIALAGAVHTLLR